MKLHRTNLRVAIQIIGLSVVFHATQVLARTAVFGTGDHAFSIEFVTVGNPGNASDTHHPVVPPGNPADWQAGSIPYTFEIGKYEISEQIIREANALGNLGITIFNRGPNMPAAGISWYEAIKFINWLNTSSGYPAAYNVVDGQVSAWDSSHAGYNADNPLRNSLAQYVLPTADEWYKAAFHDAASGTEGRYFNYPGSDQAPAPVPNSEGGNNAIWDMDRPGEVTKAGSPSAYGTIGQKQETSLSGMRARST